MISTVSRRRSPTSLLLPENLEQEIAGLAAAIAARSGIVPSRSQVLRYLLTEGCTAARARIYVNDLPGMH